MCHNQPMMADLYYVSIRLGTQSHYLIGRAVSGGRGSGKKKAVWTGICNSTSEEPGWRVGVETATTMHTYTYTYTYIHAHVHAHVNIQYI